MQLTESTQGRDALGGSITAGDLLRGAGGVVGVGVVVAEGTVVRGIAEVAGDVVVAVVTGRGHAGGVRWRWKMMVWLLRNEAGLWRISAEETRAGRDGPERRTRW
jgi:hypothetical protein